MNQQGELGCSTLTHEYIMALPSIDHSSSHPGVYLSCFAQINDQQLQGPHGHLISTTGRDYEVSSGLYAGSSAKSVSGRCSTMLKGRDQK